MAKAYTDEEGGIRQVTKESAQKRKPNDSFVNAPSPSKLTLVNKGKMGTMNLPTEGSRVLQSSVLIIHPSSIAVNQAQSHDSSSKVSEIVLGLSNVSSSGTSS